MSLIDLDRPPISWRYDRWERDIVFRPLSARQLAALSSTHDQVDGQAVDTPAALRFYAALLAATLEEPKYDEATWLEASAVTLQTLGMQALRINGLVAEDTKKN